MDRKLSFIFTPDGFYPDTAGSGSAGTQAEETVRWTQDGGFPALYDLGLKTAQGEMSPSARFLYQISSVFFRQLTELPELELARERVQVPVPDEFM